MLSPPRCPDCGARGIHCDPACIIWICTQCHPDGKRFMITIDQAEPFMREHRARLQQLEGFVKRYYTPVPGVR